MAGFVKHLAVVAILAGAALYWARLELDPSPYNYDESDYMYAASQGFFANWSDTPAISLPQFIRIGLSRGRDSSQRSDLSDMMRDSGDIDGYRHWHGTLYYYGLMLAPAANEYAVRALSFAAPLLGLLIVYFGCLWLWPEEKGPAAIAAVLCGLLFLWSPAVVKTTEIAPHILFADVSLAVAFAAAKMRETGLRRHWYLAAALAGVAFCTMELSFATIVALLICGHLERTRLKPDLKFAARSLAVLAAPIVVLWPASLYKLTFIESYLIEAYLAVFRKAAWGNVTFAQSWAFRFQAMPVEFAAIGLAVVLFFTRRNLPGRREASAFLIFGGVMLAAVLRVNSLGLRYTLPYLPALLIFAGITLAAAMDRLAPGRRWAMVAVVALLVFFDTARQVNRQPPVANPQLTAAVHAFRDPRWNGKVVLIPQDFLPTLHFYYPRTSFRGYFDASGISARLKTGHFDAVLYPDFTVNPVY